MEIRGVNTIPQGPQGLDALGATAAPPAEPVPERTASSALDPPVKIDIGADAERYVRDAETSTIVFQVVDPGSGDVVTQLPSETALRNRAYDSAHAQRPATGSLSRVA